MEPTSFVEKNSAKTSTQPSTQPNQSLKESVTPVEPAPSTNWDTTEFNENTNEAIRSIERQIAENGVDGLEKNAKQSMKIGTRLQSGAWQGAGVGSGIGAATGLGIGTVVGTVVGGVTAVPTTLLGGLIGTGTGLIHGPWAKYSKKDETDSEQDREKAEPEDGKILDAETQEPMPQETPRKKAPRKIEIRSGSVKKATAHQLKNITDASKNDTSVC